MTSRWWQRSVKSERIFICCCWEYSVFYFTKWQYTSFVVHNGHHITSHRRTTHMTRQTERTDKIDWIPWELDRRESLVIRILESFVCKFFRIFSLKFKKFYFHFPFSFPKQIGSFFFNGVENKLTFFSSSHLRLHDGGVSLKLSGEFEGCY